MRGRGLKPLKIGDKIVPFLVAPHAGAWIETMLMSKHEKDMFMVAPHAGAWIETTLSLRYSNFLGGRPPCGGVD